MIIFIAPMILIAWLEASWSYWLVLGGASLPLTLLVLMYVRYRNWLNTSQTLLLAGLSGYLLDELASPRPGLVLLAMVGGIAGFCLLLAKSQKTWQRALAIVGGLGTYQLVIMIGFSWDGGYQMLIDLGWFIGLGLMVFVLMRFIGRRVEGWV